jgi:hypothetical protein
MLKTTACTMNVVGGPDGSLSVKGTLLWRREDRELDAII